MVEISIWVLAIALGTGSSPYAGQAQRDIKALSPQQIEDYLQGRGMGYAKAAELNQYPGPKHVLELSEALSLDPIQIDATHDLFDRMQSEAKRLGRELVDRERAMDQAFAVGSITSVQLREAIEEIAALEAQIRYTHLAAHLEQTQLLTAEQIVHYDRLRGYGAGHHQRGH